MIDYKQIRFDLKKAEHRAHILIGLATSVENIDEVIIDASAAKGQSQPILVHSKGDNKSKSNKTTAA